MYHMCVCVCARRCYSNVNLPCNNKRQEAFGKTGSVGLMKHHKVIVCSFGDRNLGLVTGL